MGTFSDYMSISNSMDINWLRRRQQIQMRLAEFSERDDRLMRETGVNALGFFGFEKENPTPRQSSTLFEKVIYTAFGAAVGLVLGVAVIPVCLCAAAGFLLSCVIPESETTRLERAISRYDSYLTRTEAVAQSQMRSVPLTANGAEHKIDHTQTILAEREQAATAMRGA